MGASIAYYTAFSIAPLLIIVIAIAGLVWGQEAASGYLYAQLAGILGDEGTKAVQAMVASASNMKEGVLATVVGVALLVVGATTVFAELQSDLDRIWKAPAVKRDEGFWGMIRSRVLSLGLVVSIGFLLLVSLVVSAALAAFGKWWGSIFGEMEWLFHVLDFVVSIGVIAVMFALMYKILPRVKIAWHDVWIGAGVTALLFAIGKFLVGLYVGKTSVASSFGTAGSLAVLLVWVYYSAQIFLLGAEFTWVYAHRYGSRRGEEKPATAKEAAGTTDKPEGDRPSTGARESARRPARVERPVPEEGVLGAASRHTAALTAGAIVVGALAGRLIDRKHRA
jgi:membrane protein